MSSDCRSHSNEVTGKRNRCSASVLRYPGGKTRAIEILSKYLPKSISVVCSPFIGGGSFELFVSNHCGIRVYASDLYEPLNNFWHCITRHHSMVCHQVRQMFERQWPKPAGDCTPSNPRFRVAAWGLWGGATPHKLEDQQRSQYARWLTQLNNLVSKSPDLNIQQHCQAAAVFFVLNHLSFNGRLSGGFSANAAKKGFTARHIDRLESLTAKNLITTPVGCDFEDTVHEFLQANGASKTGVLFFFDPPYLLPPAQSILYGDHGELHRDFDHYRLFRLLQQLDAQRYCWICCYNNCNEVRRLYQNYPMQSTQWTYGGLSGKQRMHQKTELVIVSTSLLRQLETEGAYDCF